MTEKDRIKIMLAYLYKAQDIAEAFESAIAKARIRCTKDMFAPKVAIHTLSKEMLETKLRLRVTIEACEVYQYEQEKYHNDITNRS